MVQRNSPWEGGNLWTTLAFYIFNLHIPFSFGGLSVVALIIGKDSLVPQTEVRLLAIISLIYIENVDMNEK